MALQFVIGRAGSGKSRLLYEKMIEESELNQNKNYVAVVPEQYSMETQKEILDIHRRHGSFNIEVTSFTRLAYSVFEEQGISGYKVMDDLGKTMVMRKVLENCKEELIIYKNKTSMPGFAEKMKTVVSELKQYSISDSVLEKMITDTPERPSLKHKLRDIRVIQNAFNRYTKERMITVEDVLTIFCKYIPASDFIKNTYFYFDGYTGFTPVQYQVLKLLIKHAAGVKVAITLPEDEKDFKGYNKFELFYLSKETMQKLKNIAEEVEVKVEQTLVAGEGRVPYRIQNNQELCFIENHIFRNKKVEHFSGECSSVEIHSVANPYAEAEFVAKSISALVVEKGYRYKDIAVITGDMEGYYRYMEETFESYGIPAFIDHKRNISANPFVDGIKSVIEIVEKDFSYETVFHMLRLGFMDVDMQAIDIMENYVLQSGRRGYRSYSRKWEKLYKGMEEGHLEIVNECRQKVIEAVKPLYGKLKTKGADIEEYTRAVYEFILSQNMQKKMSEYAKMFGENKSLSRAKEYNQAYAAMIELLEKTVSLMGDEVVSVSEYKQILQAGFDSIQVGIIPPGLDTVMVGDVERTRLKDTKKIIFFVGVNDGIIPGGGVQGGIISDGDREFLENNDFVMAPTARENVFKQKLYLYSLLAKPTEKIVMSYSKVDSDGSVRRKSYLIGTMEKMFPNLKIVDEDRTQEDIKHITNKKSALKYVAENMREYRVGRENELFRQLSSILMQDKESKKKINLMAEGAFYKSNKPSLRQETARMLYGTKENIGITRLERFAACAYSQFLNNGLKLGERKKFEIAAFDIGNLYHEAINRYFSEIQRRNLDWERLDEDVSHQVMEQCVEKVVAEYDNDAIEGSARNLFIKKQVKETAQKTAGVLVKHIQSGSFQPAEYELRVEHGRIDRVDTLKSDNKLYVKVIDYKSGDKKFSISDTFMGLQLQLMVYLKDAVNYEKKKNPGYDVVPAGGFYFHIHDPYVKRPDFKKIIKDFRTKNPDSDLEDDAIKLNAIYNQQYMEYRMSGMVVDDPDVLRWMDENIYEGTGKSDILPVGTTQKGLSATSVVMDSKNYSRFIDYVSEQVEDMRESVMEGDISINPIDGACQYCPYGGVCNFDRKLGDHYREVEKVSLQEVVEKMQDIAEGRGRYL